MLFQLPENGVTVGLTGMEGTVFGGYRKNFCLALMPISNIQVSSRMVDWLQRIPVAWTIQGENTRWIRRFSSIASLRSCPVLV
jgi:hypothetical protein